MCKPSPVLTIFSQPVPKTGPGSEEFGNDQDPKDLLQNGVLQMAPSGQAACGAFRNLLVLSRVTTVYWEEPWHAEGLMNTAVSRSGGGLMFWVVKIRALNFGWNVESIVLKKRWALKDPEAATPPSTWTIRACDLWWMLRVSMCLCLLCLVETKPQNICWRHSESIPIVTTSWQRNTTSFFALPFLMIASNHIGTSGCIFVPSGKQT